MTLTKDFKETIRARVARDPAFRQELLREGIESMLAGDVGTGKIILRDYINATIGFAELAEGVHRSPKSLMRMLGPRGNPQAQNLFQIVAYLMDREGIRFKLHAAKA
jgi:DNA-binding phage protein